MCLNEHNVRICRLFKWWHVSRITIKPPTPGHAKEWAREGRQGNFKIPLPIIFPNSRRQYMAENTE